MSLKNKIKLYERFHDGKRLQKRIIDNNNFTYRELIKIMEPYLNTTKSVLDIGSGVGTIDFYLASKGKKVTGIEISTSAVSLAKKNAKLFNLDKMVTFVNTTFPSKILSGKYDLVIFSEVIEHLEDDFIALKEIWKILKPGGLLIITTPSRNAPLYRLGLLNKFDISVGHLRRYTLPELTMLVEKNGYMVMKSGRHEGILRNYLFTNRGAGKLLRFVRWKISNIISMIDRMTIPIFGESNIHIVAQKK